jgi:RimJ/RimL family protein N-acetyltransferase
VTSASAGSAAGEFGAAAIGTRRLLLTPLRPQDAGQMAVVLGDPRLHEFIGGSPMKVADLTARYRRLAAGSPDPGEVWLNWIVRLRPAGEPDSTGEPDGAREPACTAEPADAAEPVGTVQATVTRQDGGWAASIAWVVGVPWQGRGYASEAAVALVTWLTGRGAAVITASIHPRHHGSAAVAARAGLSPTSREADGERIWQLIHCR